MKFLFFPVWILFLIVCRIRHFYLNRKEYPKPDWDAFMKEDLEAHRGKPIGEEVKAMVEQIDRKLAGRRSHDA